MHLFKILTLFGLMTLGVNGLAPRKQVLITYPSDTPQSDLNDYKTAIISAGGEVLHEFSLLKGFVVKATKQALDTIHSLSQKHPATIEEDSTVNTQDQVV